MYSPIFPLEIPASCASCICAASVRHSGTRRASVDHELLRLIQRLL